MEGKDAYVYKARIIAKKDSSTIEESFTNVEEYLTYLSNPKAEKKDR
jgi:hypothetical protein